MLCASGLVVGRADADCALRIVWNDVSYDSADSDRPVRFGASLGEATLPFCDDEGNGGCERHSDEKIAVFRLPGIDPHVALAAHWPAGPELFLAAGFFPELPDHPLHAAIFGSPERPDERAGGWNCGPQIPDLTGAVTLTPGLGHVFGVRFEGERVRMDEGRTSLVVDARTTISGFGEFGLPRIEEGDRIRATVRECTASGERYQVVADSITNAGD